VLGTEATPPPQVLTIGTALADPDVCEPVVGQAGLGAVGVADDGRAVPERCDLDGLAADAQQQDRR
jgi:hypothetical protein